MPKIVILGSCKHEPYEILAPKKLNPEQYKNQHEKAYKEATKIFYPAIEESDLVLVYAPDGIGKHTGKDLLIAVSEEKPCLIYPRDLQDAQEGRQIKTRIDVARRAIMQYRKDPRFGWDPKTELQKYRGPTRQPITYGFYGLTDYLLTGDPDKIMDPTIREYVLKEIYERKPIKPNEEPPEDA